MMSCRRFIFSCFVCCSCLPLLSQQFQAKTIKLKQNVPSRRCDPYANLTCHADKKCLPTRIKCPQIQTCKNASDGVNCVKMEVNLKGGIRRGEGRVELKISNITGTICSDLWDDREAKVICRMLGFSDVSSARAVRNIRHKYGIGNGMILMSELGCKGNEENLLQCSYSIMGEHNCSHLRDAGVNCLPNAAAVSTKSSKTCGKRSIHPFPLRILGGTAPVYGSHPWLARVIALVANSGAVHVCGGAIVGRKWVLTSAHCIKKEYSGKLAVIVGDYSSSKIELYEQFFYVDEVYVHPDYDYVYGDDNHKSKDLDIPNNEDGSLELMNSKLHALKTSRHKLGDLALLKLRRPLKYRMTFKSMSNYINFGKFVQPACLPNRTTVYESNVKCEMAGWGRQDRASKAKPDMLQSVELPILTDEECQQAFPSLNKYFLTKDSFCAGYEREVGGCHGDSGGPLTCNINGSYILMGIASKTRVNSPNIFLRVASFADWIETTMDKYN